MDPHYVRGGFLKKLWGRAWRNLFGIIPRLRTASGSSVISGFQRTHDTIWMEVDDRKEDHMEYGQSVHLSTASPPEFN